MLPVIAAGLISALIGLAKNAAIDQPKEARDRRAEGARQRYSPWTKIGAQPIKQANNPMGDALQYGLAGTGMFQSNEDHESDKAFKAAMITAMQNEGGGNPWAYGSMGSGPGLGVNTDLMSTMSPEFRRAPSL